MAGAIEGVRVPSAFKGTPIGPGPVRKSAAKGNILNFASGDRDCFEQKEGETADCILKDIKFDEVCSEGAYVGHQQTWGECSEMCADSSCRGWTWGPKPCTNCIDHRCYLFTSFLNCPGTRPKRIPAPGFISGGLSCKDIRYIETDLTDEDHVKRVRGASRGGEWRGGKCQEEGADPTCPGQDVPDFRSQHE